MEFILVIGDEMLVFQVFDDCWIFLFDSGYFVIYVDSFMIGLFFEIYRGLKVLENGDFNVEVYYVFFDIGYSKEILGDILNLGVNLDVDGISLDFSSLLVLSIILIFVRF